MKTIRSVLNFVRSKEVVGADRDGNEFYTLPADVQGNPPRRLVDFKGHIDPAEIHPLWRSWLHYTRQDIDRWEEDQRILRLRVKEIDEKDAKLRLEEQAQRQREGRDFDTNYSAQSFLQGMTRGATDSRDFKSVTDNVPPSSRMQNPYGTQQPSSAGQFKQPPPPRTSGSNTTKAEGWDGRRRGHDDSEL